MHTTFPPELVEALSPLQSAKRAYWFEFQDLFVGLYISTAQDRETTYWISIAHSTEALDDSKRIFLGCSLGWSSLDRKSPLFDLANNKQAELEAVQKAIMLINPIWHDRVQEIIDAAILVMVNDEDPTTTHEEYAEASKRLDALGMINYGL